MVSRRVSRANSTTPARRLLDVCEIQRRLDRGLLFRRGGLCGRRRRTLATRKHLASHGIHFRPRSGKFGLGARADIGAAQWRHEGEGKPFIEELASDAEFALCPWLQLLHQPFLVLLHGESSGGDRRLEPHSLGGLQLAEVRHDQFVDETEHARVLPHSRFGMNGRHSCGIEIGASLLEQAG